MGFKGAWLIQLLGTLGAETWGYGFDVRTPLLYREIAPERHRHVEGDVRDVPAMKAALAEARPSVVLHLAAQPVVLTSYKDPLETFSSNIMGCACLLEAVRATPGIEAVVMVTSDKVYENREWAWSYREGDPLGGSDPYSASKGAAEIVVRSMARSFFSQPGAARVATARAGNVIGGGDWADHRLLPDAARSLSKGEALLVRNPHATRPWQHVLEPLSGYLTLAEHLVASTEARPAWNFGPASEEALPVAQIADLFVDAWGDGASWRVLDPNASREKEADALSVDSSLARLELDWRPRWHVEEAVERTARWYHDHQRQGNPEGLLMRDIAPFLAA